MIERLSCESGIYSETEGLNRWERYTDSMYERHPTGSIVRWVPPQPSRDWDVFTGVANKGANSCLAIDLTYFIRRKCNDSHWKYIFTTNHFYLNKLHITLISTPVHGTDSTRRQEDHNARTIWYHRQLRRTLDATSKHIRATLPSDWSLLELTNSQTAYIRK